MFMAEYAGLHCMNVQLQSITRDMAYPNERKRMEKSSFYAHGSCNKATKVAHWTAVPPSSQCPLTVLCHWSCSKSLTHLHAHLDTAFHASACQQVPGSLCTLLCRISVKWSVLDAKHEEAGHQGHGHCQKRPSNRVHCQGPSAAHHRLDVGAKVWCWAKDKALHHLGWFKAVWHSNTIISNE